jgi:hypothetical protein
MCSSGTQMRSQPLRRDTSGGTCACMCCRLTAARRTASLDTCRCFPPTAAALHPPCGGSGACGCTAVPRLRCAIAVPGPPVQSVSAGHPSRSKAEWARPLRVGPRGPAVRHARLGAAAQRPTGPLCPSRRAGSLRSCVLLARGNGGRVGIGRRPARGRLAKRGAAEGPGPATVTAHRLRRPGPNRRRCRVDGPTLRVAVGRPGDFFSLWPARRPSPPHHKPQREAKAGCDATRRPFRTSTLRGHGAYKSAARRHICTPMTARLGRCF